MEEKDMNVEMTEETVVDETTEAETAGSEAILKRKSCCKKTDEPDCKSKNPVCAAIAVGAACCMVLGRQGARCGFGKSAAKTNNKQAVG